MRGLCKPSSQLMRLCQRRALSPISAIQPCRHSSTSAASPGASIDIEAIRTEMLARPPQIHHDMMYPNNSHLLGETLSDFLPEECCTKRIPHKMVYKDRDREPKVGYALNAWMNGERLILPAGHHLVYFPLRLPGSKLCPDGTDPYHSPHGTPFTRRMWAGGSIEGLTRLSLDDELAVCLERITDVAIRGTPGAEKIFVEVLREYVPHHEFKRLYHPTLKKLKPHGKLFKVPDEYEGDLKRITERRTLVFMRELSDENKKTSLEQGQRVVKPPNKPDYLVTLTPTPALLFHYSALTYNAHRIHLDRSYCREVEGHRDLLVHGPLSLTLMLSVLQSQLPKDSRFQIDKIDYRHLAPLYVGEPMRVCVALQKPQSTKSDKAKSDGRAKSSKAGKTEEPEEEEPPLSERRKWDVWVENQHGGLCVRGTAETEISEAG
ncbi:hypothetical protein HD806DRAFT_474662 [Xylariaceae sp. AK1471]|nr:hypothetical protein HD806DRAFT_474662 [Xylariaceae sp. AK1471]